MKDQFFKEMFPSAYKVLPAEKTAFGKNWCGPDSYDHAKKVLVAVYKGYEPDGQTIEVYGEALPCRSYSLFVRDENSNPHTPQMIKISTGSDQWELIAKLAKALSEAMICIYTYPI